MKPSFFAGDQSMQWTKPDFQEITLNMEVTAYVNTEAKVCKAAEEFKHETDEKKTS
jgi:coenzyme PQQ precursor peptide PqqA